MLGAGTHVQCVWLTEIGQHNHFSVFSDGCECEKNEHMFIGYNEHKSKIDFFFIINHHIVHSLHHQHSRCSDASFFCVLLLSVHFRFLSHHSYLLDSTALGGNEKKKNVHNKKYQLNKVTLWLWCGCCAYGFRSLNIRMCLCFPSKRERRKQKQQISSRSLCEDCSAVTKNIIIITLKFCCRH